MARLTREDLYSLEKYAEIRADFRAMVMAHKRDRKVHLGPNATLYFEDRLTMQYQIQEMLRAERIYEADGIQDELDAYNPLIPDGNNWKATFMLEYGDVDERRVALTRLLGVERRIWVRVHGYDPVYAIADEDLERETEEKTSSVHFLRFELDPEMVEAVRDGAEVAMGADHPEYNYSLDPIPLSTRTSLAQDLG